MSTTAQLLTALSFGLIGVGGWLIVKRACAKPVKDEPVSLLEVSDGQKLYPVYRHKKTKGLYALLHIGKYEADCARCVIYVAVGQLESAEPWVRPYNEFFDGRFERVGESELKNI